MLVPSVALSLTPALTLMSVQKHSRDISVQSSSLLSLVVLRCEGVAQARRDDLHRPGVRVERLLPRLCGLEDRLIQARAPAAVAREPAVGVEVVVDELAPASV